MISKGLVKISSNPFRNLKGVEDNSVMVPVRRTENAEEGEGDGIDANNIAEDEVENDFTPMRKRGLNGKYGNNVTQRSMYASH